MIIIKLIVTSHIKTHNLIYIYEEYKLCSRKVIEIPVTSTYIAEDFQLQRWKWSFLFC